MKRITFVFLLLSIGLLASAQKRPVLVRAPEVKTLKVESEAEITSFESTITPGRLTFAKIFTPGDGQVFKMTYTLRYLPDNSFNNRKPVSIGLSRKSFDSVFTHGSPHMNAQYTMLSRYVSDNKISLEKEEGWVAVIKHYNNQSL